MAKKKLDPADLLNWEYLCKFGENQDTMATGWHALKQFAYDFTSTASAADQNEMLRQLLKHVTFGHSNESNEEVIAYIAATLESDLGKLRQFAKEQGVRLQRG